MPYSNYFKQLKVAIPFLMKENDVPGFSIVVVDKEKIIYSDEYGFNDLSKITPITSTTSFSIQSISKTYTAFGFMLAVQEGKVTLDDFVKKYIPSFSVKHPDGKDYSSSVTFRQLLTHRSGLAHEAPVGNNFVYSSYEEHIKSINDTFLRFKPGEKYSYSNLGIDLVAYALSKMYDLPFETYMQQKVFEPLDMRNSTFKQEDFLLQTNSAIGHEKISLVKYPIPMLGAGGMYSCPSDMSKFVQCFLNGGMHKGEIVLKNEILTQMYHQYPASDEWPYNLGLVAGLWKNRVILNHNGGGFGFLATQDIFPNDGFGAVALTNSVSHPNIHQTICRNMWSDLFDLIDIKKEDCEPLPNKYQKFVGLYEATYNGGTWKQSVIPRNGALYCNNQELIPYSDTLFFTKSDDCIEFTDNKIKYNYVTMCKCTV